MSSDVNPFAYTWLEGKEKERGEDLLERVLMGVYLHTSYCKGMIVKIDLVGSPKSWLLNVHLDSGDVIREVNTVQLNNLLTQSCNKK
jgi:hypothetical protein